MSKIPWTERTWNPVVGCTKVSAGCKNCYAERMASRLAAMGQEKYKNVLNSSDDGRSGVWNGKVFCDETALNIPLKRKKPTMYFLSSMGDVFHPEVPFDFIWDIFKVIKKCPQHTFQVLTKRPERIMQYYQWHTRSMPDVYKWPQNVWLGTSVEDQAAAHERIPHLLQTPAAVHFLSVEPFLSPINLKAVGLPIWARSQGMNALTGRYCPSLRGTAPEAALDQVIIGCESNGAHPGRECKIEWVRDIVRQCKSAGVPVFVKQIPMWQNKGNGSVKETEEDADPYYEGLANRVLLKYPRDKDLFPMELQRWEYPKV